MFAKQGNLVRRLKRRTGSSPRPKPSLVPAFARSGFPSSHCVPHGVSIAWPGADARAQPRPALGRAGNPGHKPDIRACRGRRTQTGAPRRAVARGVAGGSGPGSVGGGVRDRVSHRDAECLSASWDNYSGTALDNTYRVRNMCPDLGRVVAKVDVRHDMDRTRHLPDGIERTGYTEGRIRWIYCCSDLSAACNRSDLDRRDASTNSSGATAKGSVPDTGALAGAWLAGFGRSVASAQVDRLGERLAAGDRQPHLTLGGYRIGLVSDPEDGDRGEDADT